jgi:hypothetical protein
MPNRLPFQIDHKQPPAKIGGPPADVFVHDTDKPAGEADVWTSSSPPIHGTNTSVPLTASPPSAVLPEHTGADAI